MTLSFPSGAPLAPTLLQLHRQSDGGLFDRLVAYYKVLWDRADNTLTNLEQLDALLDDKDQTPSTNHDTPPTTTEPSDPTWPGSEPSSSANLEHAPRRWPRRPT